MDKRIKHDIQFGNKLISQTGVDNKIPWAAKPYLLLAGVTFISSYFISWTVYGRISC